MTPAEIRADMVSELRSAARCYRALGVSNPHLAGTCRDLSRQMNLHADHIESSGQSHISTRLADDSTAARVDFNINAAASSSAATLQKAAA